MPCYDHRPAEDARQNKIRLDEVTRLLCGVMRSVTESWVEVLFFEVPGLREWWTEHQELDAE